MVKINFFVLDITYRSSNYLSFLTKANRKQEYVASGCYFYKRPEWTILFENHIYVPLIVNPYILLAQNDTVIETLEYHVTPTDVVFCLTVKIEKKSLFVADGKNNFFFQNISHVEFL